MDAGGDGRGVGVEGFESAPLEVFGYGCAPVDDGAEDLRTSSQWGYGLKKGCFGLHRTAVLLAGTFDCWCSSRLRALLTMMLVRIPLGEISANAILSTYLIHV